MTALPDPAVVHLVVGPDTHGVVRHAVAVARACGHDLRRRARPEEVAPADVAGADVVHLAFTDRLFGPTAQAATTAVTAVAATVHAAGAALSLTLHDLPDGDGDLARRRRAAYRSAVDGARGVVVSSRHELRLAEDLDDTAWSRRVVRLPVDRVVARPGPDALVPGTVGVLGFLYPGKGVEDVVDEAPDGSGVVALGAPDANHPEQPTRLAERARAAGVAWRMTGHVPDEDLAAALSGIAVPVAPHRHVSASGSIATWIAHGRRPLVPDGPYTREIDAARPGTVRRYDAERPGALGRAVAEALAEPARTLVDPDAAVGPSLREVARDYRDHLAACAPPAPLRVGGRWTVPGNRIDLLGDVPDPEPPAISVVVPYYDAPQHLDLVLRGLARQDHPHDRLEVVVADDGSPRPPDLGAAGTLRARTVRQDDRGFRAAAARNLGASVADGEVIAFLDGDTVPDPGYLSALCRVPALSGDGLAVGRRRHAEGAGIAAWLDGTVDAPDPLPEPAWLAQGYAAARDLLDADDRSYRYVISAVLALHRDLFTAVGGFDEEFRRYGGEDWELAARAWHAGALFTHVPSAVAWHVGPDWAARGGDPADKAAEARILDRLLPDPVARRDHGGPRPHRRPATVVVADGSDPGVAADAVAAVGRRGGDAAVWWPPGDAATVPSSVRPGRPSADVLARAAVTVRLTGDGPADPLLAPTTRGVTVAPGGTATRNRATARAARVARATGMRGDRLVERLFGRHDRP